MSEGKLVSNFKVKGKRRGKRGTVGERGGTAVETGKR